MSKIIFLNGCGSAGKTSVAKSIQRLSNELWLTFGVDSFIDMIPVDKQEQYFKFIPGKNQHGQTIRVKTGPEATKLFGLMPEFAEMLANKGNNLIIDEVLLDDKNLINYAKQLSRHNVYYIGVFCDLEIMQEREKIRLDRVIGLSADQITRVHESMRGLYDLKVDTSNSSPLEIAKTILKHIETGPKPRVFKAILE